MVMEYNGKIIPPQNWSSITLKNFDKIELLTIVGGGWKAISYYFIETATFPLLLLI